MGHNRVFNWCAFGGVVMFKAGDTIKIDKEFVLNVGDTGLFLIGGGAFSEKELLALGAVKVRKSYTVNDLRLIYDNCDKESVLMSALKLSETNKGFGKWHLVFSAMGYKYEAESESWYKVGEE
jgi:hypothetical protein